MLREVSSGYQLICFGLSEARRADDLGEAREAGRYLDEMILVPSSYPPRWAMGVSRQGHVFKSVKVRPRVKDSALVAWEAETNTVEPSDNIL